MAKKMYSSPILMLEVEDESTISFGGSQGTSGYDSMWTFGEDISEDDLGMIELNCDDLDLQDMDADKNFTITNAELQAWLDARGGW